MEIQKFLFFGSILLICVVPIITDKSWFGSFFDKTPKLKRTLFWTGPVTLTIVCLDSCAGGIPYFY